MDSLSVHHPELKTAYTATVYVKQLLLPAAKMFHGPDDGRKDRPKHVERFTRIIWDNRSILLVYYRNIESVPLPTKPGISLIILKPMNILQQDLNRSTFVVWEMKRNVSVVCVCFIAISSLVFWIIKEMPGLVGSGTPYIMMHGPMNIKKTPRISQYPASFTDGSSTVILTDPLCHESGSTHLFHPLQLQWTVSQLTLINWPALPTCQKQMQTNSTWIREQNMGVR